ncbi:hypothetical protein GGR52DRAFT_568773 [Hypoxylon sp. FL1284]|nr:hypothetical protein GGR52DRAFT_568773 [Hypoxylon sp. FL1284]
MSATCATCNSSFKTKTTLRQHQTTAHLGKSCFYTGLRAAALKQEDDKAMEALLVKANERRAGRATPKKGLFHCHWGSKHCPKKRHWYRSLSSLKRHLRTVQRKHVLEHEARRAEASVAISSRTRSRKAARLY